LELKNKNLELNLELGTKKQELGTWNLELGTKKQELGTWNLELGTKKQELGTWNLELKMMSQSALTLQAIKNLISLSECQELLEFCDIWREQQEDGEVALIVDCSQTSNLDKLWEQRHFILDSATLLGLTGRLIFKRRGFLFGSVSSPSIYEGVQPNMILPTTTANSCKYADLLRIALNSDYPAYFVEIPHNWHWGQPQRCILTSSQVTDFSGRIAPRWHGDDVTLLFDRPEFEKRHEALMKEISTAPEGQRTILRDYEYRSYTVDPTRDLLCRAEERLYNADIEITQVEDLNLLVYICYCKERQPIT
jgi:hypothetical protein